MTTSLVSPAFYRGSASAGFIVAPRVAEDGMRRSSEAVTIRSLPPRRLMTSRQGLDAVRQAAITSGRSIL